MGARCCRFTTTIDYSDHPQFAARATIIHRPKNSSLRDGLAIAAQILGAARRGEPLLLTSSWGNIHPDLLASAIIGLWPQERRPKIVMMGCMWEPTAGWRGWIEQRIVRLADRAIDLYAVQSTEELAVFPKTWRVGLFKTRLCLYFHTFTPAETTPALEQGHIFAGGNAQRDYEPLLEAACRLPQQRFIFATNLLDGRELPPNVTAGRVSHDRFVELMKTAVINITPIRSGLRRAAGQQTYLNAMLLGKPTVVTDTLGVHDHLTHRETGLIVDGSTEQYVEAIEWLTDCNNQADVRHLRHAARHAAREQFTFENHVDTVLTIVDEALADI
ncbi:MAG: glycosyltransferase [Chloroflexota bacterium]